MCVALTERRRLLEPPKLLLRCWRTLSFLLAAFSVAASLILPPRQLECDSPLASAELDGKTCFVRRPTVGVETERVAAAHEEQRLALNAAAAAAHSALLCFCFDDVAAAEAEFDRNFQCLLVKI